MLKNKLNQEVNVEFEHIDTHKCRFMGEVNTYDITLKDKNFKYTKSILNKPHGGASILPVDDEGNVFLEIQYRFPLRQAIIELPAGRCNDGEGFLECANRELREETGCTSKELIEMPAIFAQPEFTDEKLGNFIALSCQKTDEQELDSDEAVTVIKVPFDIAVEMIRRNIIIDERTIIAIGEARCILGLGNEKFKLDVDEYIKNMLKTVEEEGKKLEEKEVDIDYTEICEFGVIQDHVVKVPGNKNSRRECFYVKAGDLVLPISRNGKVGVVVRYMPSVGKNLVQLPSKIEFGQEADLKEFGELVTAVGYANDRQYMYTIENLEETDDFIWLREEDFIRCVKNGDIEDGRVLAIVLKRFL